MTRQAREYDLQVTQIAKDKEAHRDTTLYVWNG